MYTHVLFDLDGTLTDSSACIARSTAEAFAHHGLESPPREKIVGLMGVPLEKSLATMNPAAADPALCAELITTYRRIYAEIAPSLVSAFPGVHSMLEGLVTRGVRTAVVTSKHSRPAEADTRAVGIRGHIHAMVGSDHVANHKPHPEPALHALKLLGSVAGRHAVVVGDSVFDLEMGRAAGVRTIGVTWGAHAKERLEAVGADHIVATVAELAAILASTANSGNVPGR